METDVADEDGFDSDGISLRDLRVDHNAALVRISTLTVALDAAHKELTAAHEQCKAQRQENDRLCERMAEAELDVAQIPLLKSALAEERAKLVEERAKQALQAEELKEMRLQVAQVSALQKQVDALEEEADRARKRKEELKAKVSDLCKEVEETQEELREEEMLHRDAWEKLQEAEQKLEERKEQSAKLQGTVNVLQAEAAERDLLKSIKKPAVWKNGDVHFAVDASLPEAAVTVLLEHFDHITKRCHIRFHQHKDVDLMRFIGGVVYRMAASAQTQPSTSRMGWPGAGNLSYVDLIPSSDAAYVKYEIEHETICHVILGMPHIHQCSRAQRILRTHPDLAHDVNFNIQDLSPYWDYLIGLLGFLPCNSLAMYQHDTAKLLHYGGCVWKNALPTLGEVDEFFVAEVYRAEFAARIKGAASAVGDGCDHLSSLNVSF